MSHSNVWVLSLLFYCACTIGCSSDKKMSPKERKVVDWLQRFPPDRLCMRYPDEPVPYDSYEEWGREGRKIKGIEQILISFYPHNPAPVQDRIILRALGYVGSQDSVPVLIEALGSKDRHVQLDAAVSLGQLRAREAVQPLCKLALSIHSDPDLRANVICVLGDIGDPRAKPVIEEVLKIIEREEKDAQEWRAREKDIIIRALEKLKEK